MNAVDARSVGPLSTYLRAPEEKVAALRKVFSHALGPKVGLVWARNSRHQFDHHRPLALARFAQFAAGVPAHFFDLQKEHRPAERQALSEIRGITNLSPQIGDFEDTAAIVTALDVAVTVDTSVAQLAGALGVRTRSS